MSDILESLSHLEASGLIAIAKLMPELEYLFRHALVQDAAYDSLLRQDRRKLHRAVGEALESAYPDRLDDLAPTLATHFRESDNRPKAIDYFCRAGDHALTRYANQEAEMHYRAGLELASEPADRARLMSGLGEALVGQSRMDEAIRVWSEAVMFYREMGDLNNIALLFARSARAAWWTADPRGALDLCEQGFSFVPADLETKGMAALLHEAARSSYFNGQAEDALGYCQKALAMAQRLNDTSVEAESLITLALLYTGQAATDSLERAIEVAESNGLLAAAGRAHHNLGIRLMTSASGPGAAIPYLHRAAEMGERRSMAIDELFSKSLEMNAYALIGETAAAMRERRRVEMLMAEVERTSAAALTGAGFIGVMLRLIGEFDEARRITETCLQASRLARDESSQRSDLNELALIALLQKRNDEAQPLIEEALILSTIEHGEAAWTHCLASMLYVRQGELDQARDQLDQIAALDVDTSSVRVQTCLLEAQVRLAAAESRWPEAEQYWSQLIENFASRGLRNFRARWVFEWATLLLDYHAPDARTRALGLLRDSRSEFEAMQAPAYVALIDFRIAELTEGAH